MKRLVCNNGFEYEVYDDKIIGTDNTVYNVRHSKNEKDYSIIVSNTGEIIIRVLDEWKSSRGTVFSVQENGIITTNSDLMFDIKEGDPIV